MARVGTDQDGISFLDTWYRAGAEVPPRVRLSDPRRFIKDHKGLRIRQMSSNSLNFVSLGTRNCYRPSAMVAKASFQVAATNLPHRFSNGVVKRWNLRPSYAYRVLSLIHSSFRSPFVFSSMRITWTPLESIFEPRASNTSTNSVFFSSH